MFEPTLLDVLAPGEPYMVLSRSGRILQVGPALVDILGANPSGRNLNDLMDEAAVVRLLTEVTLEDILTVDCELCRCFFTCGARLTEEGNIMLVFKLLRDLRDEGENRLLVRYMGIQIAELVGELSIAIERLSGEHTEACSQARSAAEKSLWNLLRIARNAPLKADFGIDGPPKLARPGDLAVFLADLLRHTAEVLAPYHDLGIELEVDSLPCVYDELNIRRAVLNLLAYAIHRNTLPRARMQFGVSRSGDQLILRLLCWAPAACRSMVRISSWRSPPSCCALWAAIWSAPPPATAAGSAVPTSPLSPIPATSPSRPLCSTGTAAATPFCSSFRAFCRPAPIKRANRPLPPSGKGGISPCLCDPDASSAACWPC